MCYPGETPGRTPFDRPNDETPTHFDSTQSTRPSRYQSLPASSNLRYDPSLSLDAFQAEYTSTDNASFGAILQKDNAARKEKNRWAWDAQEKANIKAIQARETREKLVEMTRKMVDENDGVVNMIEGGAGRPGDRRLIVEGEGFSILGASKRLMVEGSKVGGSGMLLIDDGTVDVPVESKRALTVGANFKGKGKEVDYIDYDEFDEEAITNNEHSIVDVQAPVDTWKFTVCFNLSTSNIPL